LLYAKYTVMGSLTSDHLYRTCINPDAPLLGAWP